MSWTHGSASGHVEDAGERGGRPAAGKVSRSERLPRAASPPEAMAPVQADGDLGAAAADDPFALHLIAQQGVAGGAGALPHGDAIQRSFGHHDVSGVHAHVGGAAAEAATAIGARAYATGDDVAFAGAPDLRQAAHEATHVVQQRGGVRLDGGIGRSGDVYEQHADAVADLVVRGESAQALLDPMAHRGAGGGPAVQRLDRDGDGIDDETGRPVAPGPGGAATGHGTAPAAPGAPTAPAAPAAAPGDPAAIQRQLTLACDYYFNSEGSVMAERRRAVDTFCGAIGHTSAEPQTSLLGTAAGTALSLASGQIGGIIGQLIGDALADVSHDAAHAVESYLEHFIESSLEHHVEEAATHLVEGGPRSVSEFQELQGEAIAAASLAGRADFETRTAALLTAPDGLRQATALVGAYRTAAPRAYNSQFLATQAQWNRILTATEGIGASVMRNLSDGNVPGVLTIDFDVGDRLTPSRASIPDLTEDARRLLHNREGTLGELYASGQVFRCNLVFSSWRPFSGTDQAIINASRGSISGEPHPGLVEYCNAHYGTTMNPMGDFDLAASIIWARAIHSLAIRSLPEIG